MRKVNFIIKPVFAVVAAISFFLSACSTIKQKPPVEKGMVVWYNKPAGNVWLDGLFIGNGYMGANVFGRIQNERIALNESSFWSGRPHDAYKYFGQIKDLVFSGKFKEAENLANEHFYGKPTAQQAYQPLGELLLDFRATGDSIQDYHRELDMETGVVKVSYTEGNVEMTREVFMSYPDHVMVMNEGKIIEQGGVELARRIEKRGFNKFNVLN